MEPCLHETQCPFWSLMRTLRQSFQQQTTMLKIWTVFSVRYPSKALLLRHCGFFLRVHFLSDVHNGCYRKALVCAALGSMLLAVKFCNSSTLQRTLYLVPKTKKKELKKYLVWNLYKDHKHLQAISVLLTLVKTKLLSNLRPIDFQNWIWLWNTKKVIRKFIIWNGFFYTCHLNVVP